MPIDRRYRRDLARYGGQDPHRAFIRHAERAGGIVAITIAIWLISGAGYFWPIYVIVIAAIRLGMHARRAYGSFRSDDDDDD